jgi:hypothetical protein
MTIEEITGSGYDVADYDKPFLFEENYFKHWQQKIIYL